MLDLIVIGAGGCGLMTALVAAEAGASVLVLEKTGRWGGGTALSHRALRGAGTRFQSHAGVVDSPERYAEEILGRSQSPDDEELARALTAVSARMIEFLADVAEVDFELDEFTFGQSASRSHKWSTNRPITDFLFDAVEARPSIEVRFDSPVRSLLGDLGTVGGVRTEREDINARKVVIACGGFGANPEMLARHIPHAVDAAHSGHDANTGDGIEMGVSLGAAIRHMDAFQPYPAHVGPGKRGVPPGVILAGGIVVEENGSRFVDETKYPGGLARAILGLPSKTAYEIFDEGIFASHRDMTGERSLEDMLRSGDLASSGSTSGLASALGIDANGLSTTLEEYASAVGGRDRFGRAVGRPLQPPLYGIEIRVALYHTQGGLVVDRHGRVLRPDGEVIPNLYAGGGAAAGISGDGMDGYLPGNGLLASLGLGMIIAEHAVYTFTRERSDALR